MWNNGRKYNGEWKNNNMHGKGLYTRADGRSYDGEFRKNNRNVFFFFFYN
jgi:hypothetical protein